jgi:hypothetical protein
MAFASPRQGDVYVYDGFCVNLAPAPGVLVGGLNMRVEASDDVAGFPHVDFVLDGAWHHRDERAPYELPWNTLAQPPGLHHLEARAVDHAGNVGSAALDFVSVPYYGVHPCPL